MIDEIPGSGPPQWSQPLSGGEQLRGRRDSDFRDDFRRAIVKLRRQLWVVVLCVSFGLGFAFAAIKYGPTTFHSSVTILIDRLSPANSASLAILDRIAHRSETATEIKLIGSRRVVETVVDQLDLHVALDTSEGEKRPEDVFGSFDAGRESQPGRYRFTPEPPRPGAPPRYVVTDAMTGRAIAAVSAGTETRFAGMALSLRDIGLPGPVTIRTASFPAAVETVRKRLDVALVDPKSDLIALGCTGPSAAGAQRLCDAISNSYLSMRTELQRAEASKTAAFLREQVARVGAELAAAENRLATYTSENWVGAFQEPASEEIRQHAQLGIERDQIFAEREVLGDFIAAFRTGRGKNLASFPTFPKNEAVTKLLENLIELEDQRARLVAKSNQISLALDERIARIEGELESIATSYERGLTVRIESLDRKLESAGADLKAIPGQQLQVARLERETSLLDDLYRLLEGRLREVEVAEALEDPGIRIVDTASMPLKPSSSRPRIKLALGLAAGLVLGLALALYREMMDTRFRESAEVEGETGLPVLAMLPRLRSRGPVLALEAGGLSEPGAEATAPDGARAVVTAGPQHRFLRHRNQDPLAVESFHSLAVDLQLAGHHLEKGALQSVAITSSRRGDGKTFTACNLALACAAHSSRTLLIDADMRAGDVARFFDLPSPSLGLSDVLAGDSEIEAVWTRRSVGTSDLWVVPAGTPTPHYAGLLDSPNFERLLARVTAEFDLVILDTPPLNLVMDAATIGAAVDGTLLVVRGGVTDRAALEMTLERLGRADALVLGVVLNGARLREPYASYFPYTSTPATDARSK